MPAGPGVRDDSGVTAGSVISVHYDPMISKLAVWADTRAAAIERMRRALGEYHVGGIRTNLPFHRQVMRHPAFIAGEYDTGFIERHKAELAPAAADDETAMLAAVAAAAHAAAERRRRRRRHPRSIADAAVGVEERPQGLTAAAVPDTRPAPSKTLLLVAFATVYVVWGSTYLAIRIAVEHWPPLWLASVRFAIAGGGLYAVLRLRGAPAPGWRAWLAATVVGRADARGRQRDRLLGRAVGPVGRDRADPRGGAAVDGPAALAVPARARAGPLVALGVVIGLVGVGVLIGGPRARDGGDARGDRRARAAVGAPVAARREPQLGHRVADPAPLAAAEVGRAGDRDGDGGRRARSWRWPRSRTAISTSFHFAAIPATRVGGARPTWSCSEAWPASARTCTS